MAKAKTVFRCGQCGHEAAKWLGRCPDCGAWNTLVEESVRTEPISNAQKARTFRLPESGGSSGGTSEKAAAASAPVLLGDVASAGESRAPTGIGELDRVLGGGLVPGSLILVGGDPGIGKSTLLLQALGSVARAGQSRALYVTGEESPEQVKLRASRLGLADAPMLLLAETRADRIVDAITRATPPAVVIDSIQTVYDPEIPSAPGSVSQVREVAARFLYLAKSLQVPIFLVGHVTKEGALAGPRVLEHMVDTVLYFESTAGHPFRILRAHKNRFGSTNEIGVFEMRATGLEGVLNPSEMFLSERPVNAPGSVVFAAIEGTRPLLVEVQALVGRTRQNDIPSRRTCLGYDSARAAMLIAVLERRASYDIMNADIFVNVAGGISLEEPAADLAVATALVSSFKNGAVPRTTVLFGEIGLAGELRAVSQVEARLAEAAKLGFTRAVMPEANMKRIEKPQGIELVTARDLDSAMDRTFEDG